jgi:hypothetical protein
MKLNVNEAGVLMIDLANKPGTLNEIATLLSEANINVLGIAGVGFGEEAKLGLYVEGDEKAHHDFLRQTVEVQLTKALVVSAEEDVPGVLQEITSRLMAGEINIEFATGSMHGLVLITNDNDKAKEVLTN